MRLLFSESPPEQTFTSPPLLDTTPADMVYDSISSPPTGGTHFQPMSLTVGIASGAIIPLCALCLWIFCKKKKESQNGGAPDTRPPRTRKTPINGTLPSFPPPQPPRNFTYDELSEATNNFSNDNFLGKGGFGSVYKGVLRDKKEVAVKKLQVGSLPGQTEQDFQVEIDAIGRVRHRNLVSLVGYCKTEDQMLLVCEFVPNNTLEHHLKGKVTIPWERRMKIAAGLAEGIEYLHRGCNCKPKIIHRDIKASNILLDKDFEVKVADFGLAKDLSDSKSYAHTDHPKGTRGYMAPEMIEGTVSAKSDVYAFGVVLLQLITGRPPIIGDHSGAKSLVDWATPFFEQAVDKGNYDPLVDSKLKEVYEPDQVKTMLLCAAVCVRRSECERPKMSEVLSVLRGTTSLDKFRKTYRGAQSSPGTKGKLAAQASSSGTKGELAAQEKEKIKVGQENLREAEKNVKDSQGSSSQPSSDYQTANS